MLAWPGRLSPDRSDGSAQLGRKVGEGRCARTAFSRSAPCLGVSRKSLGGGEGEATPGCPPPTVAGPSPPRLSAPWTEDNQEDLGAGGGESRPHSTPTPPPLQSSRPRGKGVGGGAEGRLGGLKGASGSLQQYWGGGSGLEKASQGQGGSWAEQGGLAKGPLGSASSFLTAGAPGTPLPSPLPPGGPLCFFPPDTPAAVG